MATTRITRGIGRAALALLVWTAADLSAADCNRNGVEDEEDILVGTSLDCNINGVPDECDVSNLHSVFTEGALSNLGPVTGRSTAVDLDGDGDHDLLFVPCWETGRPPSLSIVENTGAGTFELRDQMPLEGVITDISPVDIDGDGDQDVLIFELRNNHVMILRNLGGFRFEFALPISNLYGFHNVAGGDIDADGDVDLVISSLLLCGCAVIENRGEEDFGEPVLFRIDRSLIPVWLTLEDLDRDGTPEVLLTDTGGSRGYEICVFLNAGDGSFRPGPVVQGHATSPAAMPRLDLDGDGTVDYWLVGCPPIAIPVEDGRLLVPRGAPVDGDYIAIDMDGDGDVDLVGSGSGHSEYGVYMQNLGDDTFAKKWLPGDGVLMVEDFQGDGLPDILLFHDVAGNLMTEVLVNELVRTSADLDRDGRPDECQWPSADCNGNGVLDTQDIASGRSSDCNENGVPDECDTHPEPRLVAPRFLPEVSLHVDLNGDGVLDGLERRFRTQGEPVIVSLLFDRRGTGRAVTQIPTFSISDPLATGDLDGDGIPDVIVSSIREIRVHGGRGDGSFELRSRTAVETSRFRFLLPLDIDGDGDSDLLFETGYADDPSHYGFLLNRGDGRMDGPYEGSPATLGDHVILARDLNGDHRDDLLIVDVSLDNLEIRLNTGQGRFDFENSPTSCWIGEGSVAVVDYDRDGDLDLVIDRRHGDPRNGACEVEVWRNPGDGRMERQWLFAVEGPYLRPTLPARGADGVLRRGTLSVNDLDGDSDLDIALLFPDSTTRYGSGTTYTGEREGGVRVFLQGRSGSFRESDHAGFGLLHGSVVLESDDVDDDGAIDLRLGSLWIRGNGDGSFDKALRIPIHDSIEALAAGDFTGDARCELAALTRHDESRVYLLQALSDTSTEVVSIVESDRAIENLATGDFDGDGRPDLILVAAPPRSFAVYLNRGNAGFLSLPWYSPDGFCGLLAAADFTGDGLHDLVLLGSEDLEIWRNEGEASFRPVTSFRGNPGGWHTYGNVVAGDFDGDGAVDIAAVQSATCCRSPTMVLWRQLGALVFERIETHLEQFEYLRGAALAVADVDGDGREDIAACLNEVQQPYLTFFHGRSSRGLVRALTYDPAILYASNPHDRSQHVAAADFNGDGWPDVALAIEERDHLSLLAGGPPDPSPSFDLDDDGQPDECQSTVPFTRGDVDQDGGIDITDAVFILEALFRGGPAPLCAKSADADDSGAIDLSDPVRILGYLFLGASRLPRPFPGCGPDPSWDELGCEEHRACGGV
ncbi:MAG: VCBS repeat-containing protein [Planctomycetes bacterium]|nr:VCBS repeat-containing protein [Planctomycetota bacterium]